MDFSLNEYNLKKAFNYGVMVDHAKKVMSKEGSLGERIVHALITSIHIIPVIGQISALAESLIATKLHDQAGQLGRISQDPAAAAYQRGALQLYGSMLTKPGTKQAAMIHFKKAADLGNSNAMVQLAIIDKEHNYQYMWKAAEQDNVIALNFQSREIGKLGGCYFSTLEDFERVNSACYVSFEDMNLDNIPLETPVKRIFNNERANATALRILEVVKRKDEEIEKKLKNHPDVFEKAAGNDFHTQMLIEKNLSRGGFMLLHNIGIYGD